MTSLQSYPPTNTPQHKSMSNAITPFIVLGAFVITLAKCICNKNAISFCFVFLFILLLCKREYVCCCFFFARHFIRKLLSVNSFGCTPGNKTEFLESATLTEEEFQERPIINWDAILFVNRPTELWAVQLILALISLTEAMLLTYLGYKVSGLISK